MGADLLTEIVRDPDRTFRRFYTHVFARQQVFTVFGATFLVAVFALGDLSFPAETRRVMLGIRLGVSLPLMLFFSLLHLVPRFRRWFQFLGAATLIAGAGGLMSGFLILGPETINRYSMALLLMVLFAFALARLRFRTALGCTLILLPVAIASIGPQSGMPVPGAVHAMYVTAAFLVGLAVSYTLEWEFQSFYRSESLLRRRQRELQRLTRNQERTIETRTAQLRHEAQRLRTAISERDTLYRGLHHHVKNQMQVLASLMELVSRSGSAQQVQSAIHVLAHLFEYFAPAAYDDRVSVQAVLETLPHAAPRSIDLRIERDSGYDVPDVGVHHAAVTGLLLWAVMEHWNLTSGAVIVRLDSDPTRVTLKPAQSDPPDRVTAQPAQTNELLHVLSLIAEATVTSDGPAGNGPAGDGPAGDGPAGNGPAGNAPGADETPDLPERDMSGDWTITIVFRGGMRSTSPATLSPERPRFSQPSDSN